MPLSLRTAFSTHEPPSESRDPGQKRVSRTRNTGIVEESNCFRERRNEPPNEEDRVVHLLRDAGGKVLCYFFAFVCARRKSASCCLFLPSSPAFASRFHSNNLFLVDSSQVCLNDVARSIFIKWPFQTSFLTIIATIIVIVPKWSFSNGSFVYLASSPHQLLHNSHHIFRFFGLQQKICPLAEIDGKLMHFNLQRGFESSHESSWEIFFSFA